MLGAPAQALSPYHHALTEFQARAAWLIFNEERIGAKMKWRDTTINSLKIQLTEFFTWYLKVTPNIPAPNDLDD